MKKVSLDQAAAQGLRQCRGWKATFGLQLHQISIEHSVFTLLSSKLSSDFTVHLCEAHIPPLKTFDSNNKSHVMYILPNKSTWAVLYFEWPFFCAVVIIRNS